MIYKFCIIFLLYSISINATKNFEHEYNADYNAALEFLRGAYIDFSRILKKNDADPKILLPVIFPELIRFSLFRNEIEVTGLKIFYINLGLDYANFSIGRFQMKPSFVAKLENHSSTFKQCQYIKNNGITPKKIRSSRIKRLMNIDWQLHYLACFYHIVRSRHKTKIGRMTLQNKIRFFAAAYNSGFHKSYNEIIKSSLIKTYPHGKYSIRRNFRYTDIAWYFAANHLEAISQKR